MILLLSSIVQMTGLCLCVVERHGVIIGRLFTEVPVLRKRVNLLALVESTRLSFVRVRVVVAPAVALRVELLVVRHDVGALEATPFWVD